MSRLTDLIAATEVTDLALGQELEWAFQVERSGRDPRVAAQTLREEGPEVLGTSRGREGWLVDAGGFSAAARQLNKSVTMVSNHVQALEDRLGARLLNRTTRKISLTDIGRTYLERSRQILQDLEEADRLAEASQATPRGTLRLYSGDSIVRFLAPVMGDYLSLNPEVEVDLRTGEQMVDLIEDGFDVVIRGAPPDSRLIVRRLTLWRHFLCCAAGFLETQAAPARPADLATLNCLRFAFYPYGHDWRFAATDGETVSVRVGGNFVTHSGETLRLLTLAGHGVPGAELPGGG